MWGKRDGLTADQSALGKTTAHPITSLTLAAPSCSLPSAAGPGAASGAVAVTGADVLRLGADGRGGAVGTVDCEGVRLPPLPVIALHDRGVARYSYVAVDQPLPLSVSPPLAVPPSLLVVAVG
jgi:hypothetical protein